MSLDATDNLGSRLKGMKQGDDMIYHIGMLASDRFDRPALHKMAATVFGLQIAGRIELYQKKLEDNLYEYHLRILHGVRSVDLDRALKLWAERMETASCK